MQARTILKPALVSLSVGVCATSEVQNTRDLTELILGLDSSQVSLSQLIVVTPNHEIAQILRGRDPRIVVELEKEREGKASALNRIIRLATGEILVLASADIKLTRSTIPKLVDGLVRHDDWGAVDSRVELINGDKMLMDRISNLLWDVHNATLDELDGNHRLGHVAGDLLAVRRSLFDELPDVINDDAYLALKIQQKGFRIKRVQDAIVWIVGPRTPTDYVYQRSRVLHGHLQLIKLFGKMPSTFEFQVLSKPRRYLGLFVQTVAKLGPSHILPLIIAGALEFLSFHVALFELLTQRSNRPWKIAQSTKKI